MPLTQVLTIQRQQKYKHGNDVPKLLAYFLQTLSKRLLNICSHVHSPSFKLTNQFLQKTRSHQVLLMTYGQKNCKILCRNSHNIHTTSNIQNFRSYRAFKVKTIEINSRSKASLAKHAVVVLSNLVSLSFDEVKINILHSFGILVHVSNASSTRLRRLVTWWLKHTETWLDMLKVQRWQLHDYQLFRFFLFVSCHYFFDSWYSVVE